MAKWILSKNNPVLDGSGHIAFDIMAADDNGDPIGGKHTTILLDADRILAALDLGVNSEINAALKGLVKERLPIEWMEEILTEIIQINQTTLQADVDLDAYVADVLGGFPITFNV